MQWPMQIKPRLADTDSSSSSSILEMTDDSQTKGHPPYIPPYSGPLTTLIVRPDHESLCVSDETCFEFL